MNIKKVQFACEILTEQMNHLALFPIALTFMGGYVDLAAISSPNIFLWIICSLFPFAFFMIRSRVDQVSHFILLHFAVIAAAFLIPTSTIPYRVLYVVTAVYYALISLRLRYKKNQLYSNVIQLPVSLGITFLSCIFQLDLVWDKWRYYYNLAFVLVIALFFIIFYIQRYLDFLNVNKSSAGYLPARDMFRSGLNLVLWFTGGCVLIFLLSMFTNVFGELLTTLKDGILKLLRYLFSLLPKNDYVERPLEKDGYQVSGGIFDNSGRTYFIWEVLQFVFLLILFIGAVYLLVKLIILLIKFIQGRFASTRKTVVEEEETIDIREKCEIEKRPERKKQNPFDRFSPQERIRRLYKKKLTSSAYQFSTSDAERLGHYTAAEWEVKLQTNGMATVYEQARYSNREMTNADVKKMKDACNSSIQTDKKSLR